MMKKHKLAAIVVGVILAAVSFLPVILTMNKGIDLAHPKVMNVFLYPAIGITLAAIIVFMSFSKDKGE